MAERRIRTELLPALLLLGAVLAPPVRAQTSDDEQICRPFLEWLTGRPAESDPRKLVGEYREVLLGSGMPMEQADRRMEEVWRCAFRDPRGVRLVWDKVYAGDDPVFREAPNALLMEFAGARAPGKALDVGMGQGRNALYLALSGWEVTGFDPSREGIRIAESRARRAGVKLRTVVATDDEFDFGTERWDLIVVTYVRVLTAQDAERIWSALRPGGLLVYENGAEADNQILEAFLEFRILRYENVLDYPDWNPEAKMRLQRLVAQRESE